MASKETNIDSTCFTPGKSVKGTVNQHEMEVPSQSTPKNGFLHSHANPRQVKQYGTTEINDSPIITRLKMASKETNDSPIIKKEISADEIVQNCCRISSCFDCIHSTNNRKSHIKKLVFNDTGLYDSKLESDNRSKRTTFLKEVNTRLDEISHVNNTPDPCEIPMGYRYNPFLMRSLKVSKKSFNTEYLRYDEISEKILSMQKNSDSMKGWKNFGQSHSRNFNKIKLEMPSTLRC